MTNLDTKTKRRSRGRPALRTENETRAALIEAARTEFLAEGYTGTSIEAVAQHAGMSTRTIYKTIFNKADLFRLVMGDAIDAGIAQLNVPADLEQPANAFLVLARAYTKMVLGAEGVLTARAVMAEQSQFPELRNSYLSSIDQVATAFDNRFAAFCDDMPAMYPKMDHVAASLLRSMITGAQRSAILHPDYRATPASLEAWSDKCTTMVLNAYAIKK